METSPDTRSPEHAPRAANGVTETPIQELEPVAAAPPSEFTATKPNGSPEKKAAPESKPGNPNLERVTPTFPIVGIGGSAGAFEAMHELLGQLGDDTGIGFVVIQHMDPTRDSHLAELLQRQTKMPVREAKHGEVVMPNHVYINPPQSLMTIRDGALRLSPRTPGRGHEGSIDQFLGSLANDRGDRAIAVILSGTLSDGRDGLTRVHHKDGFTFAQQLDTAKYQEMPRSAIATGCVDFILDPAEIGQRLTVMGQQLSLNGEETSEDAVDPGQNRDLVRLLRTVHRNTGVDFSQYKRGTLDRRIHRRMIACQCATLPDYASYVERNPAEAHELYEEILIHVTEFFRDPSMFTGLRDKILPELLNHRDPHQPLRVWIPGCATGEEAYSLAMVCLEYMHENGLQIPLQIFATDLSERAIRIARTGAYSEQGMKGLPPALRRRYTSDKGGEVIVNKMVRSKCVFAVHDVTRDPPFSNMDLVSCRNLLIYLEADAQRLVLEYLHYALRPSGYLILGASETPERRADLFRSTKLSAHVYRPKGAKRGPLSQPIRSKGLPPVVAKSPASIPRLSSAAPLDELERIADRVLSNRTAPASIIVNSALQILASRGDTSPFLRATNYGENEPLPKKLRGSSPEVVAIAKRTIAEGIQVEGASLPFKGSKGTIQAIVDCLPVRASNGERHAIVIFRLEPVPGPETSSSAVSKLLGGRSKKRQNAMIQGLQHELQEAKVKLQAVVEDYETTVEMLRCANEEALSSNEELQSTNEELQTTTEESQSTAEELRTLNEELMFRNMEIHQINNDLLNILNSVDVAILLLNQDFRIHRFTLRAQQFFGLKPGDIGSNFYTIKPAFMTIDLCEETRDVLESLQVRRFDAKAEDGHTYQIHIHPYRTTDDRIEGAVIVVLEQPLAPSDAES